jgi:hypothetical protein
MIHHHPYTVIKNGQPIRNGDDRHQMLKLARKIGGKMIENDTTIPATVIKRDTDEWVTRDEEWLIYRCYSEFEQPSRPLYGVKWLDEAGNCRDIVATTATLKEARQEVTRRIAQLTPRWSWTQMGTDFGGTPATNERAACSVGFPFGLDCYVRYDGDRLVSRVFDDDSVLIREFTWYGYATWNEARVWCEHVAQEHTNRMIGANL